MSQLQLFLFGQPRVVQNGKPIQVPKRKALALLIYLAATRKAHSRDALAALFWPESDQKSARASLRRTFYELTRSIDKAFFTAQVESITLAEGAKVWLDVEEFQRGVVSSLSQEPVDLPSNQRPLVHLPALVDLYSNDFLDGFSLLDCPAFDDWQFFLREELRRLLAVALRRLLRHCELQRDYTEAAAHARRWLALDPTDEPVHRELMRLYALAGQQGAALRQYQECVRLLNEELGIAPDVETTQLYELIRSRQLSPQTLVESRNDREQPVIPPPAYNEAVVPGSGTLAAVPIFRIPYDASLFVGREAELAQVATLLGNPRCRLISIVGLGGIGKTQLALQAAGQLLKHGEHPFADGVVFVPLLQVESLAALPLALSEALNLTLSLPSDPAQQLLQFLRTRQMLMILDNVEHLLHSTGGEGVTTSLIALIQAILEFCPHVKLVITSREPLRIQAEWRVDLQGLTYPEPADPGIGRQPPLPQAVPEEQAYSAVRLFVEIAQQYRPGFQITPENRGAIYRLCQLVAGMPLALKLAAGWIHLFSVDRITAELERSSDILATQMRDAHERQRSLSVILDYTWNLLSPLEKRAFRAMSIFRDGFTEEAVRAVAGLFPHLLAGLLDRGLLHVQRENGEVRYRLHELVNRYAAERLTEDPVLALDLRRRHSDYYLNLLRTLDVRLEGTDQQSILQTIHQDLENIRAAWHDLLDRRDVEALFLAQGPLYRFFWTRCRVREGKALFADAIAHLESDTDQIDTTGYARLLRTLIHQQGLFDYFLGNYAAANGHFLRALEIARRLDMPKEIGDGLVMLGTLARCQAQRPLAEAYLHESLTLFRKLNYQSGQADALQELALLYSYFGESSRATILATESLSISRAIERVDWIAWALDTLGWISFTAGNYERARQCYAEGLDLFRSIEHHLGTALALGGLALVEWALGGHDNLTQAQTYLEESAQLCRQIGHQLHLASRLFVLAQVANDRQAYGRALVYAQEGLALARSLDSALFVACNLCCLGEAAYYQGDFNASRRHLHEAVQIASQARLRSPLMIALYQLATSNIVESEMTTLSADDLLEKQVEALELLSRVEKEETCWTIYRQRSQQRRAELIRKLPATTVTLAATRERSRTLGRQIVLLLAQSRPEDA